MKYRYSSIFKDVFNSFVEEKRNLGFIYETEEYLTSIRKRFYNVIDALKETENIVVINADGTVDEVAAQIENAVMSLY